MELLDTSLQSQFNTPQDRWKSSTQQIHSHDPQEQQEETPKSKFRLVGVTSLSSKTEDKPQTFSSFSQRIKTNTSSFGQHISMKSPEELSQQPSRSPNTPEEDSPPSRKYRRKKFMLNPLEPTQSLGAMSGVSASSLSRSPSSFMPEERDEMDE